MFTQEHKGAGAARNLGLAKTHGEYIMFLDADDLFPSDYVGKMVSAIEDNNADMAVCQFFQTILKRIEFLTIWDTTVF